MNFDEEFEDSGVSKKWFEDRTCGPKEFSPVTEQTLIEVTNEAKQCHDSEALHYDRASSKTKSNYKWIKTVMAKGTISDKVAAYTVAIQDNPVCNLETLRSLVNMVKVQKKKECITVISTLTELFLSDLLIPDSKLKSFHQQPLSALNELTSGNAVSRRKILSVWYFEDQLKEMYTSFVLALNNIAHDTVDSNKEKALTSMYKLLAGNPEQEKNLLSFIINKLGDPSQKIASKVIYNLSQLLYKHPNMQLVVLNEVEKLLFRTNISTKAQYYSLCFLSQFYLNHEDAEVARRLIELYFSFFKACIKKGEVDSRMMSALLMGVNRAYPYAKLEIGKISEHIDTIYRVVHIANFNIGLHALTLLFQVSQSANNMSDRFYSALYRKLIDSKLFSTTHQAMLLSLIYKALLNDPNISRIRMFVKRLLQLTLFMQPSFACGVLYLVSQLMSKKENIQSLVLKQSSSSDDDNGNINEEKNSNENNVNILDTKPSKQATKYNALSRNPVYGGEDFSAYTELTILNSHFHPTVALYANNLLEGNIIKYSGDPLKDFTLIRFLDRFVFKNPKSSNDDHTSGAHPTFGKRRMYRPKGFKSLAVNSDGFLNESFERIPVDELFMHTFIKRRHEEKRTTSEDEDSDLESVQSDEFEAVLDKMGGDYRLDDDLDFMDDIQDSIKNKPTKKNKGQNVNEDSETVSTDDDEDDEQESELDDLDMNEEDRELLDDLDEDEDDEIMFDEESEDDQSEIVNTKKNKSKKGDDINSLFASADEFASLLEDEGSAKVAPGKSSTFVNRDNTNVKQVAWEEKRNQWLKGYNKAVGKGKPNRQKSRGKRSSDSKSVGNKTKKRKRY